MWSRINLIYLALCACAFSLLSMGPANHSSGRQWVWIISSISYPFFLGWTRPATQFWKGPVYFLSILTVAQICGFLAYMAWYGIVQYRRLLSVADAFSVARLNIGESAAFFIALDLLPSLVVAAICYSLGFFGTHLLIHRSPSN